MTILDTKLSQVEQCKQDIKNALVNKGVDTTNVPFTNYASKINTLPPVKSKTYLFKAGEDLTSITGEWVVISRQGTCSFSIDNEGMHLYGQYVQGAHFGTIGVRCSKFIDLGNKYVKAKIVIKENPTIKLNGDPSYVEFGQTRSSNNASYRHSAGICLLSLAEEFGFIGSNLRTDANLGFSVNPQGGSGQTVCYSFIVKEIWYEEL